MGDQKLAFSIVETGQKTDLHPDTVRTLIRTGRLRAVRVGRRYIVPATAIDEFLADRFAGPDA